METQVGSFIRGTNDGKLRRAYLVQEQPRDALMLGKHLSRTLSPAYGVAVIEVTPGNWQRQVVNKGRIERLKQKEAAMVLAAA